MRDKRSAAARCLESGAKLLALAFAIYALTFGPASRYMMLTDDERPKRFYAPIDAAMEQSDSFDYIMRWYLKAWGLRVNIPGWSKCGD